MRQKWESGRAPLQVRCAWIGALACIAAVVWAPATALADQHEADEGAESSTSEKTAAEMTQAELDEAQAAIEEAEKQLEEAKKQMELMGRKLAPEPEPAPGTDIGLVASDGRAKKLQWSLNDDGTLYFRLALWLQVWTRAMQLNPGTTILGNSADPWYADVGIRRARFLAFGQIFPRTFVLMHFGINNQTFRNSRKPQLFFHDAWTEFQVTNNKALYIGGGLLYWNGISRATNASTITFMSLDAPIVNWPLIERSDQFARQLGIYAKGKAGIFDYRVAAVKPFTAFDVNLTPPGTSVPALTPGGAANYRGDVQTWAYTGYFMLQFLDEESNVLPYTVGTYIGAKKVFNLGFGGYAHPKAVAYLDAAGGFNSRTLWIASGDLFLDIPFKGDDKGAATWYGVFYHQDFGPNAFRNVGIMNPGDGGSGTSLNGQGNAYPLIGTGNTVYSELGILTPGKFGKTGLQLQPYVNYQGSKFQALNEAMHHFGIGLNMFIHRHNSKVTLEYRNRPVFNSSGNVENRKGNSFVLQMHMFI